MGRGPTLGTPHSKDGVSGEERAGNGSQGNGPREPGGVEDVAGPVVPTDRVGGAKSVFLLC